MNNFLKSIIRNRLVQSLLFWAISFFLLLRVFVRTDDVRIIDIIYTGLFHIPLITGVLTNQFFLNRYLDRQKYITLLLGFLISLFLISQVYFFTFDYLAPVLFPDYYFVVVYEWYEMLGIGFVYLSITTLLHFAKGWFQQQEDIAKLARLEEENKRSELQALRAQVNPHFLFNSLNTIYNEALKKSEKAPQLILKLSDMLRYVVDKLDQDLVSFEEEITYLKNFIELHKERLNDPSKVKFMISGDFSSLKIAPLLLLNFVENTFKHADLTDDNAFISIKISTHERRLTFVCANSFFEDVPPQANSFGSGIENAKRRLELAYPHKHSLHIEKNENTYHLELKLELD